MAMRSTTTPIKVQPKKTQPVQPQKIQNKKIVEEEKQDLVIQQWKVETYATSRVPPEQVREVKAAFDIFDIEGTGFVDPVELKNAFITLGFASSNKLLYQILQKIDTQFQNGLNFDQFLNLATGKMDESRSRTDIERVFTSFDTNKTVSYVNIQGKISEEQFKKIAQEVGVFVGPEQSQKIFAKADGDKDGFLTAEDFYSVITSHNY